MSAPYADSRLAQRHQPGSSPVMYQRWRDLLFLHWSMDPRRIQDTLPPGLTVDTWEGKAWIGVVPFVMSGIRPRFCPSVPGLSAFPELNLRTYVYDETGTPGVWFYSLDAAQSMAVKIARQFFHLPYFRARMSQQRDADLVHYQSHRRNSPRTTASRFVYSPARSLGEARPETLEFFLVERYVLFSYHRRRRTLHYGRVHHVPYPLHEVELIEWDDNLFHLDGFPSPERPPDHRIFSHGVDVRVFPLRHVGL